MKCEGPFRFELIGAPKMRFDGRSFGGMVQMLIDDAGERITINSIPLWVDKSMAGNLERAVAAFNREMLRDVETLKEAAE